MDNAPSATHADPQVQQLTQAPYYADGDVTLHLGKMLDVLPTVPDASVDAIVCDPPYGLADHHPTVIAAALAAWLAGDRTHVPDGKGFMGNDWDRFVPPPAAWDECWRVLKPGGHLVAFAGSRTADLMGLSIRLAGFEVRDSLHWIYGSGFPKGQDIAKSIDKHRNERTHVLQVTAWLAAARDAAGWTNRQIDALWGFSGMGGLWTTQGVAAIVPTPDQWDRLRDELGFDDADIRYLVAELNARKGTVGEGWVQRKVVGMRVAPTRKSTHLYGTFSGDDRVTVPATDAARRWQGWNTQLKPAHEPIILARKSTGYESTVANVLMRGTGALNIDGCRTPAGQDYVEKCASVVGITSPRNGDTLGDWTGAREDSAHDAGRWPTNILLGHGPDCADLCAPGCPIPEMGTEARFFPAFRYEAKAPASERPRLADGTAHPTVKPLALMQWLVRLVTPPNGVVLDPFAGSGTTLQAAVAEGMRAIGVEQHQPYADLTVARLSKPIALGLFGEAS